jgi:hypothetical protein
MNIYPIFAVLCFFLSSCKSGSEYAKSFYFPRSSMPEDSWQGLLVFQASSENRKFSEKELKPCSITIYNERKKIIYSENFHIPVGIPEANIKWEKYENIYFSIINERNVVLFDRELIFSEKTGSFHEVSK